MSVSNPSHGSDALKQVSLLFLKLGTISFGGPAAHIALMENEVVRRRHWLTNEEFLDLLGATNFIPGPNSTEMAIHIGYRVAGWPGLLAAGVCFILPAALIVTALAALYVAGGHLPAVESVLYGIKPVIIAVVAQAIWSLSRSAIKNRWLAALAVACFGANLAGANELLVILLAAVLALVVSRSRDDAGSVLGGGPLALPLVNLSLQGAVVPAAASFSLLKLFLFFLKVGSVLYGSGYVLLAFLRSDLVSSWHWLSEAQLLDAIAVGQFTPGPVFTTATFIGYLLAGPLGALAATVGIFLPAFFFVAATAPFVARIRSSKCAGSLLNAVNVASLAVMAVTTVFLARAALIDVTTILLAILSGIVLIKWKPNSAWLVAIGAACGWLLKA